MNVYTATVNFLTDNSRKISSKAIFLIFGILVLAVIDNTLSFSYYQNASQKISLIKEISEGINDPTLSISERDKLIEIRSEILEHRTWKDETFTYLTNLNFEREENTSSLTKQPDIQRNYTIHLITSTWWILIPMAFLILGSPFILYSQKKNWLVAFFSIVFLSGICYLIALFISKIFSFIPLINGNALYNYLINLLLSSILLGLIMFVLKKIEKKKV